MRDSIDRHSALIYTMVLVSAAEGQISDAELSVMGNLVRYLPVFKDFETDRSDTSDAPREARPVAGERAELASRDVGSINSILYGAGAAAGRSSRPTPLQTNWVV